MGTEPLDLDALKALDQAATEGPWHVDHTHSVANAGGVRVVCSVGAHASTWPSPADGTFIAAARTALPQLVAVIHEVRRLHRGPRTDRHGSGCVQCGIVWPCPTALAVGLSAATRDCYPVEEITGP